LGGPPAPGFTVIWLGLMPPDCQGAGERPGPRSGRGGLGSLPRFLATFEPGGEAIPIWFSIGVRTGSHFLPGGKKLRAWLGRMFHDR